MDAFQNGSIARRAYPAGPDQSIVLYLPRDMGAPLDPGYIFSAIAADAAEWDATGWRIVSTDTMSMRQMGTTGNMLFQSGGQFATEVCIVVVYSKS